MKEDKDIIVIPNEQELEKQFEYVDALIEQHRSSAIVKVNTEAPNQRRVFAGL